MSTPATHRSARLRVYYPVDHLVGHMPVNGAGSRILHMVSGRTGWAICHALALLHLTSLTARVGVQVGAISQDTIPADTVISLQRGNCEGGCPVYRVLIFADGDVIWQGRARVNRLGLIQSRIERDQVRALLQTFNAIDYFRLENIYGYRGAGCVSSTADLPLVITSLSSGGRSRTITHHDGCVGDVSKTLSDIENSIDGAVNTTRWISGRTPRPAR